MKIAVRAFILLLISGIVLILCMGFGSVHITEREIIKALFDFYENGFKRIDGNMEQMVLLKIRIPRLLLAFIGGGILSIIGILMQTITKNPLAEPYVLGISSGASAGAVSAIILHWFSVFGE